jgi:CRP-like cAMP-binding protein
LPNSTRPRHNHLLGSLPDADFARLLPDLHSVVLPLGWPVYEAGQRMHSVYFPTTGVVSMLHVMQNGESAEIAVIGNDGVVGVSLFMGGLSTPSRGVVQNAGHGYALDSGVLQNEFGHGGPLQRLLLRYTQALITQMTQTAVCNRMHTLEQQLARWVLMSLDRLPSDTLEMTQELIANMLGTNRSGATAALAKLQRDGSIEYTRGCIKVPDRTKLEARVCECYALVKREVARLFPLPNTRPDRRVSPGAAV